MILIDDYCDGEAPLRFPRRDRVFRGAACQAMEGLPAPSGMGTGTVRSDAARNLVSMAVMDLRDVGVRMDHGGVTMRM